MNFEILQNETSPRLINFFRFLSLNTSVDPRIKTQGKTKMSEFFWGIFDFYKDICTEVNFYVHLTHTSLTTQYFQSSDVVYITFAYLASLFFRDINFVLFFFLSYVLPSPKVMCNWHQFWWCMRIDFVVASLLSFRAISLLHITFDTQHFDITWF